MSQQANVGKTPDSYENMASTSGRIQGVCQGEYGREMVDIKHDSQNSSRGRICGGSKEDCGRKYVDSKHDGFKCGDSNLSKSELTGLKSLKKRFERNEVIITETDKSR